MRTKRSLMTVLTFIMIFSLAFVNVGSAAAQCDPAKNPNCPVQPDNSSDTLNGGGKDPKGVANGVDNKVDTVKSDKGTDTLNGGGKDPTGVANGLDNKTVPVTTQNVPAPLNTTPASNTAGQTSSVVVTAAVNTANTGSSNVPSATNGNQSGGNPNLTPLDVLYAFEATLNFQCGLGASNSNVACWNHFPSSNLWQVQNNGGLKPVCSDTGNANNELVKDHGGWLVKLDHWYKGVQSGKYVVGGYHTCP